MIGDGEGAMQTPEESAAAGDAAMQTPEASAAGRDAAMQTPEASAAAGDAAMQTEASAGGDAGDERTLLFEHDDAQRFRQRWESLQASFVDQPRQAVEGADELVVEVMQRLTDGFSQRRGELEAQWERGGDASTEDLRVALTRYRSFFNRLLAA